MKNIVKWSLKEKLYYAPSNNILRLIILPVQDYCSYLFSQQKDSFEKREIVILYKKLVKMQEAVELQFGRKLDCTTAIFLRKDVKEVNQ